MNTFYRLLACFILTTVAVLGTQVTSQAQSVSPVPAPTIITSAPYTITAPGYYQLGANLNYNGTGADNEAIITINASNVTLDFAGHFIAGPTNNAGTFLYGVYAAERANVLIQNGTIAYCYIGVFLNGSGSATTTNHLNPRVLNMTLTKCYYSGAQVVYAITPEVADCRISSIGGTTNSVSSVYGLNLGASTGGKATNNSVTNVAKANGNGGYGILSATYAVGNTVTNCQYGLVSCTKYKDNLTSGCATPFNGGSPVGDNN